MTIQGVSRWRAALDTKAMDDLAKGNLATTIGKMSQTSTLIAIPAIAACVAAITTKAAALKTSNEAVDLDEKKLKTDITARDTARVALDTELVSLKSLVVNHATSAGDVTGMGFQLIDNTVSRLKPDAPTVIVKPGKQHGKARVAVAGKVRGHFVAEMASAPNGPYSSLPGNGKERKLSGLASGTKLWVHFAQVRYGLQSDWSTPALVTIP